MFTNQEAKWGYKLNQLKCVRARDKEGHITHMLDNIVYIMTHSICIGYIGCWVFFLHCVEVLLTCIHWCILAGNMWMGNVLNRPRHRFGSVHFQLNKIRQTLYWQVVCYNHDNFSLTTEYFSEKWLSVNLWAIVEVLYTWRSLYSTGNSTDHV